MISLFCRIKNYCCKTATVPPTKTFINSPYGQAWFESQHIISLNIEQLQHYLQITLGFVGFISQCNSTNNMQMQLLHELQASKYISYSVNNIPSLVRYAEVKLAIKPEHPTSIRNILFIQSFLIHYFQRYSFPTYVDVPSQYFPQMELLIQLHNFLKLTVHLHNVQKALKLKQYLKRQK